MCNRARGLFITGTDTNVGKTYVAALIAQSLHEQGRRVGVYKPAASGCEKREGTLLSDDAVSLWEAAGQPRTLDEVCPQRFVAPLAPYLAARAEGRQIDRQLLRDGLKPWLDECDIVIVEGAGGLLSPLGDDDYVADLAVDFGFPLVVVAANAIGVINQTLQTLHVAENYRGGLPVAGVVLNDVAPQDESDPSQQSNLQQLRLHCQAHGQVPVLAHSPYSGPFDEKVDWWNVAQG